MIHRHVRAVARATAAMVALLPLVAGAQKDLPSAPTDVRAAAQGTSAAISWTPVAARGTTYRVLRTPDASKPGAELARGLTGAAYVDAKVEPGATYFYQVAAVYADGTTRVSAAVSLTVPGGVKSPTPTGATGKGELQPATLVAGQLPARAGAAGPAPANLAAAPAPTSVALTWSAVPSFASYAVERSIASTGQWTLLATVPGPAYSDAAMDADTPVQYRITAKYADGRSGTSTPLATRTTKPTNPPNLRAAVTPHISNAQITPNFQAASLAYADVTLTWDPVPGANTYDVTGSGLTNTRSTATPTFQIPTVSPGNASWQVVAYFTNGLRRFGDTVNPSKVSVMLGSSPVDELTGVTYAGTSPAQVDFRWTNNNGATSFKLFRAESEGGAYAEVAPPNFAPFWARDYSPGLQRSKTYYYKLLSIFPSAPVAWTSPVRIDIPPWAPINGLAAAPHAPGIVWLRWDQVPGASGIVISRAQGSGAMAQVISTLGSAGGFSDSGLSPGTTYRYSVCALGGAAKSCAEVTVTTSNP